MIPVLAPPRSCSSLITAMLGQHPELYAPAELMSFTGDTLGECVALTERVPVITLLVHSEDLLADPEASLAKGCCHLGITDHPTAIESRLHH